MLDCTFRLQIPHRTKQHVHDAVAGAVSEAAAQSGVSRPELAALQVPPGRPEG
jgi:hypothetical protein